MRHCSNHLTDHEQVSPAERSARREVRRLRGFYHHLSIYLIVNLSLAAWFFLNASSPRHSGFLAVAWGIGLAIHGLRVFLRGHWLGNDWEEAKVQSLLQKNSTFPTGAQR